MAEAAAVEVVAVAEEAREPLQAEAGAKMEAEAEAVKAAAAEVERAEAEVEQPEVAPQAVAELGPPEAPVRADEPTNGPSCWRLATSSCTTAGSKR